MSETSEWRHRYHLAEAKILSREAIIKVLAAERDALVRLLKFKGDHHWTCQSTHLTGLSCDCGYDEAYQAIPEDTQKEIEDDNPE